MPSMNSTRVMPITVPTLLLRVRALKWRSSPILRSPELFVAATGRKYSCGFPDEHVPGLRCQGGSVGWSALPGRRSVVGLLWIAHSTYQAGTEIHQESTFYFRTISFPRISSGVRRAEHGL